MGLLKTDYKDDVFEGNRKYRLTQDADGNTEIQDVTEYNQQGDTFGAEDINNLTRAINQIQDFISVTLPAANWTGTEAPFVQTVTVEGITETDKPDQGIIYPENCTRAQQKAINKATGYLYDLETGDGTVTFRATLKPTVDITLGLKGVN
ncbi:hypothetical protein [Lacrimispora sp. 210928-DFI.3.58]|uniref:hypothetical protein n=1 Tax=Lacrimispora sp. 210928-DFI.3.58 TaxID=2883214 RepID=UPI001D05E3AA|nr:hypothetical protein [Lacrimispora sp. 210928-DFI.3.58]MCB7321110.1 hypothetical protein [Lacrimispora sp. 210928-DFI.3.58]